ncbi:MAG: MazG nucleotide pyrophosphohydrolase domain-containing protein [Candidatus Shapirobacteria bacterium]|jgi:NTP pyrophosphatase (non-canonical NTP hydrolase)
MPELNPKPTLKDYQDYVTALEKERGFSTDLYHYCLMLGEEVGELFKAIRKAEKQQVDANSKIGNIDEELADVFIFICTIANKYNINLEQAFRAKEEINKNRIWK